MDFAIWCYLHQWFIGGLLVVFTAIAVAFLIISEENYGKLAKISENIAIAALGLMVCTRRFNCQMLTALHTRKP